jgi:hypothetical protein
MSNEELIEELLWTAYQKGMGVQLAERAGELLKNSKIDRIVAYEKAYNELGLSHDAISHN